MTSNNQVLMDVLLQHGVSREAALAMLKVKDYWSRYIDVAAHEHTTPNFNQAMTRMVTGVHHAVVPHDYVYTIQIRSTRKLQKQMVVLYNE